MYGKGTQTCALFRTLRISIEPKWNGFDSAHHFWKAREPRCRPRHSNSSGESSWSFSEIQVSGQEATGILNVSCDRTRTHFTNIDSTNPRCVAVLAPANVDNNQMVTASKDVPR
jgi:hypothetical protein